MTSEKGRTEPYHILMVAPTSFFADYGCHVRILEETRVLQRLGHRVTIVTYAKGRDLPDVTIHRTARLPWHADYEVGSSRHKFAFDAYLAASVARAVLTLRPDIIHGHLHEGALIGYPMARLTGAPLIFDYQGSMTAEMLDHGFLRPGGRREAVAKWGEERINRLPDAVITSSVRAEAQYEAATPGRTAQAVPDVVNPHVFYPTVLPPEERLRQREALGVPPDAEVVVYLGLLAPYQGTDHLLRAAVTLTATRPQAHCLIMGYPNVERYRDLARELGLAGRVTFTGRVPYEDAPRLLALGDVAVAPKLSLTEGAGKLLNYMAMGLPTVAFDTDVSREYMGDLGVYAPAGDDEGLAHALAAVLADPNRASLGQRLREHVVTAFPWEGMGRSIVGVYEAALRARRPRAADRVPPTADGRPPTARTGEACLAPTADRRPPTVDEYRQVEREQESALMDHGLSSIVHRQPASKEPR